MITSETELKGTSFRIKQQLRDVTDNTPILSNLSDVDLINVCTLNILLESATEKLKGVQDDKE